MAFSQEAKKEILLETFEVLKDKISESDINLDDISSKLESNISKMAVIDIDIAIEMWKYVLQSYNHIHKYGNATDSVTDSTVTMISKAIGLSRTSQIMLDNSYLRKKIFNESASVNYNVIGYFLNVNDLKNANDFLDDVYTNKNHSNPYVEDVFGEYLDHLIYVYCKDISEEAVEFLFNWLDKVETEEAKAKIKLSLLEHM